MTDNCSEVARISSTASIAAFRSLCRSEQPITRDSLQEIFHWQFITSSWDDRELYDGRFVKDRTRHAIPRYFSPTRPGPDVSMEIGLRRGYKGTRNSDNGYMF